MKKILPALFILSAVAVYGQSPNTTISVDSLMAMINKRNDRFLENPYPAFSVSLNNKEYSNQNIKGKVVFINFWFATCAPCMTEMNDLNHLFEKFRGNKNFEFLSFTFENAKEIERIKKEYHIQYPVFSISPEECRRLNLNNGYPMSVLIDSTGNIKFAGTFDQNDIPKYLTHSMYPLIDKELSKTSKE